MATYVDAHHRAYAWADKAIAFRLAGKVDRAEAAVAKARHWLLRILALEADAARDGLARTQSRQLEIAATPVAITAGLQGREAD